MEFEFRDAKDGMPTTAFADPDGNLAVKPQQNEFVGWLAVAIDLSPTWHSEADRLFGYRLNAL